MKVVLDVNVLLVSIPRRSKYRPIFDALINNKFDLIISNDILTEYVEILTEKTNKIVASNIAETLLALRNVKHVEIYFEWKLMTNDPDDNKYVDANIAKNARYLVSNDKHFNILKNVSFPRINCIKIDEFLEIIKKIEQ